MIKMRQVENKRSMARPGDFCWHTPTKKKRFITVALHSFSVDKSVFNTEQWKITNNSIITAGFCHWDGNVEQPSIDQIDLTNIQITRGEMYDLTKEEVVVMPAPGEAVGVK